MFDASLFFGFPISENLRNKLDQVPNALKEVFILNGNSDYLQEIEIDGISYLGKSLPLLIDITSLDLMKQNIFSLLKRLLPLYHYDENHLVVLGISENLADWFKF